MTPSFGFNHEQPINSLMILSNGRNVCVINLLALFGKNKDIIDVAKSSLYINFYQTIMGIYSIFSIGDIISITFE
jgi:hypothetical protein